MSSETNGVSKDSRLPRRTAEKFIRYAEKKKADRGKQGFLGRFIKDRLLQGIAKNHFKKEKGIHWPLALRFPTPKNKQLKEEFERYKVGLGQKLKAEALGDTGADLTGENPQVDNSRIQQQLNAILDPNTDISTAVAKQVADLTAENNPLSPNAEANVAAYANKLTVDRKGVPPLADPKKQLGAVKGSLAAEIYRTMDRSGETSGKPDLFNKLREAKILLGLSTDAKDYLAIRGQLEKDNSQLDQIQEFQKNLAPDADIDFKDPVFDVAKDVLVAQGDAITAKIKELEKQIEDSDLPKNHTSHNTTKATIRALGDERTSIIKSLKPLFDVQHVVGLVDKMKTDEKKSVKDWALTKAVEVLQAQISEGEMVLEDQKDDLSKAFSVGNYAFEKDRTDQIALQRAKAIHDNLKSFADIIPPADISVLNKYFSEEEDPNKSSTEASIREIIAKVQNNSSRSHKEKLEACYRDALFEEMIKGYDSKDSKIHDFASRFDSNKKNYDELAKIASESLDKLGKLTQEGQDKLDKAFVLFSDIRAKRIALNKTIREGNLKVTPNENGSQTYDGNDLYVNQARALKGELNLLESQRLIDYNLGEIWKEVTSDRGQENLSQNEKTRRRALVKHLTILKTSMLGVEDKEELRILKKIAGAPNRGITGITNTRDRVDASEGKVTTGYSELRRSAQILVLSSLDSQGVPPAELQKSLELFTQSNNGLNYSEAVKTAVGAGEMVGASKKTIQMALDRYVAAKLAQQGLTQEQIHHQNPDGKLSSGIKLSARKEFNGEIGPVLVSAIMAAVAESYNQAGKVVAGEPAGIPLLENSLNQMSAGMMSLVRIISGLGVDPTQVDVIRGMGLEYQKLQDQLTDMKKDAQQNAQATVSA